VIALVANIKSLSDKHAACAPEIPKPHPSYFRNTHIFTNNNSGNTSTKVSKAGHASVTLKPPMTAPPVIARVRDKVPFQDENINVFTTKQYADSLLYDKEPLIVSDDWKPFINFNDDNQEAEMYTFRISPDIFDTGSTDSDRGEESSPLLAVDTCQHPHMHSQAVAHDASKSAFTLTTLASLFSFWGVEQPHEPVSSSTLFEFQSS
jgi:hypothetical protein